MGMGKREGRLVWKMGEEVVLSGHGWMSKKWHPVPEFRRNQPGQCLNSTGLC